MNGEEDTLWEAAYQWLCRQRRTAPAGADVWDLRWRWHDEGPRLYQAVVAGDYRLAPMQVWGSGPDARVMWSSRDALVLRWVSQRIAPYLPAPERCMHLKGQGIHASLREVATERYASQWGFVHRTDIRGYYAHIRKAQVMSLVERFVPEPVLVALVRQYVYYSTECGGEFHTPQAGIPRGCALSPLIGGGTAVVYGQSLYARRRGHILCEIYG